MTTDSTKAMGLEQVRDEMRDFSDIGHLSPKIATLREWLAAIDAHLAPREVTVSDDDVRNAWEARCEQRKLWKRYGPSAEDLAETRAMLESFALQADRQRGGGIVEGEGDYEQFAQYFEQNYNGTVEFYKPRWHAEKIWRAAKRALLAQRGQVREGWSERHNKVARFALWRFIQDAHSMMEQAAQDKDGRLFKPGAVDAFSADAKTAEECRAILDAAPDADAEGK